MMNSENHERELQAATGEFQKALEVWRKSRPEYAKMIAGVKAEKADDDMNLLAASAGSPANEVPDLRSFRQRAANMRKRAADYPESQKLADKLGKNLRQLELRHDRATTIGEGEKIFPQIAELADQHQQAKREADESRFLASQVELAVSMGLL